MEFVDKLEMETTTRNKLCVATAALAVACSISYIVYKLRKRRRNASELFNYLTIKIVTTEEACDQVVQELRRRCQNHRALGFDCEWVTNNGKRHPVALMQLSSLDGYCCLFRLNALKTVPKSLKNLLQDTTIYKVGVAPWDDGKYLNQDYGVSLTSSLDIRHLAQLNGIKAAGLATLSAELLGVVLDKNCRIRCGDWEANELTERQVNYAAVDAHVAVKIFAILLAKLGKKSTVLSWVFGTASSSVWANLDEHCSKYADLHYKMKHVQLRDGSKVKKNGRDKQHSLVPRRYAPMRTKPLYNNGFLQAPDGELLCTCDKKKAMWFLNKGLAVMLKEDPITIRLNFEPGGRALGDPGRYYTLEKENKCVVCGEKNSYIRKNVVPKEYRRNFPDILKDHASHDVILLCAPCHQRSNMFDNKIRQFLVKHCDAPMPTEQRGKKTYEDAYNRKIRSNARALKYLSHKLPEQRRKNLEDDLLKHYLDHDEVTEDLLNEACDIQVVFETEGYESHGAKVTDYYIKNGGLHQLEELWRTHFLESMQPLYMPALWSTRHTEERLRLRFDKGIITQEDLNPVGMYLS